jgi:flagellar FliL protein
MSAAAPAAVVADTPVPIKGKRKLIVILAIALAVVLAGSGAAILVLKKRAAAAAEQDAANGTATTQRDSAAQAGHRVPPTYVALDPFVVNLADKDTERYAQVGLTLEVDDPQFAADMKLYMPAIRNSILMILAHKSAAELLERSGKEALAAEIIRESVRPMGIEIDPAPADAAGKAKPRKPPVHNPVRRVLFASFIVQ